MSIRLGIDASQLPASCAVSSDKEIIASATIEKPIENFPALIRGVINRANICLDDIDEIVVCVGPGSQTGVRSAVVTGNALSLALNKPISGVLSTDSAAMIKKSSTEYKVAVSAGKKRWYVESYKWNSGKIQRLNNLQLIDEVPANVFSAFSVANIKADELMTCASGILMVAEQQRQLIEQSLLSTVLPYEKKRT